MNTGIIGFGKMGKIRYKAIKSSGATVSMICDINTKSDYDDPLVGVQDYREILSNDLIDAVFICTPNYMNKKLVIESLEAGKHVFCEKPPAFTANDVKEIIEIEKESGKILMYGFNHRHHKSIKKLKHLIASGDYGKVLWMRGRYGKSSNKEFFNGWRATKELSGGGILIDQGIHMLDLFLYIADDFHDVGAFVSNQYWKTAGVEDNVFAIFRNRASGITASLHSTMTQWRHLFSFEIFLEKGYFTVNGLKTSSGTYGPEVLTIVKNRSESPMATWSDEEQIAYETDESWNSEIRHFFNCIKHDRPIRLGNSQDALKLMTLVDKIYNLKDEI